MQFPGSCLRITWVLFLPLEELTRGGKASMHKPATFGGSCPPSSPFPCAHPWSSIFGRLLFVFQGWQWVFLAILWGTWFYSLHKSKDTIKATHQRAIKGSNNSTLLWRGRHWMRTVSAAANAGDAAPGASADPQNQSLPGRQESDSSRRDGICRQNILSSSVAWSNVL